MLKYLRVLAIGLLASAVIASSAIAYTRDYDISTPINHILNSLWPSEIRSLKNDIWERLDQIIYGFGSGEDTQGIVNLPFVVQSLDPLTVTDTIQLYSKTINTKSELVTKNEDGVVHQLTQDGALYGPGIVGKIPTASTGVVPGMITAYGGSVAPDGWFICDGSQKVRATYSDLYAVIGTTYGVGDGSTTFNVPNLKSRVPVGVDTDSSVNGGFTVLGDIGGEPVHTLTVPELPAHPHTITLDRLAGNSAGFPRTASWGNDDASNGNATVTTGSTGSNTAHNNMQPYILVNYIIKY